MKIKLTVVLLTCLITVSIPVYKGYAIEEKPLQQQSEKQYQDIISSLLMPHVGPHLDVGVDQITITVEGTGEVIINKFEHIVKRNPNSD